MASRGQPKTVSRQQRFLPEGHHHDAFFGRRQQRAPRRLRSHRRIGRRGPLTPPGHRLGVQAVAGGKGPGDFFRRFELSSRTLRRAGATVKNFP